MVIGEVDSRILSKWIDQHGCIGRGQRRWTWWQNPDGLKGLMPWHETRYFYRGQSRRYWSCGPSISRGIRTRARSVRDLDTDERVRLIAAMIRADWYCQILKSHPALEWAKKEQWEIERMALAQHYEVPTGYLDLTESIEVALFFGCCEFIDGQWQPRTAGRGILYRLDWRQGSDLIGSRIKAVGLQPFARPYAQWAWTIELMLGENFEDLPGVEGVLFEHSNALGEQLLRLFEGGNSLMPADPLRDWAIAVRASRLLPYSRGVAIIEDMVLDPLGIGARNTDEALQEIESVGDVKFESEVAPPFDSAALAKITADWESRKQAFVESLKGQVILVRTQEDDDETKT